MPNGNPAIRPDLGSKFGRLDTREQVMACVDIAKRQGLDFLVLDQTRPDIEVPVVRVIVPGLRHFYRRFAPGRLYDVPIKLGWLDRPVPESELNPLSPQDLRSPRLARSGKKECATAGAGNSFRPAWRPRHARSARGRRHRRHLRRLFGRPWESSARPPRTPRRSCAQVCRLPRSRPAKARRQGNRICWSGAWPRRGLLEYRLGRRARRRGPDRHRTAGGRLLAADAAAPRYRHSRAVAVRLYAAARQRHGAGIAARRRAVQDLRSEDRGRSGHALHTATIKQLRRHAGFPGRRAARAAARLPNPFQGRRRRRQ